MEAILSSNFRDFGMGPRREITFPMFGDGIFNQDGHEWKQSRELLRPQFHFKEYADLGMFSDACDNLLDNIPASSRVVDLQPLFFRLTLDVTTAFLFGESIESLKAPENTGKQTFAEAFNVAQEYIAKRFRLLDLYWLVGGKEFRDACEKVRFLADQIIDRNLSHEMTEDEGRKYVFLRAMAKKSPDRNALRSQIINILTAGRDTTACLLSWTFFLLIRHPQVLEKLRVEISELNGNTDLTRTDLRNVKYLQHVLKETLRLYPPVPVNARTALCTTVLPTGGGPDRTSPVLIPKGSSVAYSVYTMHRLPDLYGMDAELFRPERWDEPMGLSQNETNSKWGYLPFNGGPRICLGMDFALTEAAYTVVRIIQKFPTIKLPGGELVELVGVEKQRITMVMSITGGCNVELRQ
ncbi:Uncharacterized protein BP5553_02733 [Venustampulla echinocandica]|uniref:Cytochrome P450 alkane hydroxylase n=1 Tax=Venustampulla echinocandica TaxID=2656787 RepID=A0A370TSA7_9HELO|nr:Uncharacterized protein BP5553_02733 [Venustampulla echinocandica]RDL38393.1 Uncharacterized protein BP5553_02733 [Venustampulla echinocandica]